MARRHQELHQRALDDYVHGEGNHSVRHDYDPGTGWNGLRLDVRQPPPYDDLALTLGDALNAARGALDYLVNELVSAEGGQPGRHNAFPILLDASKWSSAQGSQLKGVDTKWIAVVRDLQPFTAAAPEQHPLADLDRLNSVIKHRTIPMAITAARPLSVQMSTAPGHRYEFSQPDAGLADGNVILAVRRDDNARVEFGAASLRWRIGFDDGADHEWDLDPLLEFVEQAVAGFDDVLS